MKQYDTITVYDTMTVAELKTLAKEIGVKLVSGMKKQDIIDALKEAEQNGQTEKKETENAADASEDRKTTSTSEKQNIQKKTEPQQRNTTEHNIENKGKNEHNDFHKDRNNQRQYNNGNDKDNVPPAATPDPAALAERGLPRIPFAAQAHTRGSLNSPS